MQSHAYGIQGPINASEGPGAAPKMWATCPDEHTFLLSPLLLLNDAYDAC